jgi:glyceraldehyde-3-phosphate dehydrogenase (ferredoxin)
MLTQQALHVDLADGHHDIVELESPHFMGPLAYGWDIRSHDDPTVLGTGPLVGRGVPGADALVMAASSPLWDGFLPSLMEGAGPALRALGFGLLALRGRAPQPSVLSLRRRAGQLEVTLHPLDPASLWKEGGLPLLLERAAALAGEAPYLRLLGVGPAAAATRAGSIGSVLLRNGRPAPGRRFFARGGFGSRLFNLHGLCAVAIGGDEPAAADPVAGDRFHPGMSQAELEAAVYFQFSPHLRSWGSLGQRFLVLRGRTLWFNSSSVLLSEEEREELFSSALLPHLLLPARRELEARKGEEPCQCGEDCPIGGGVASPARQRSFEAYAALGPQLGVVRLDAVDKLCDRCELLGLDPVAAGGTLGWLMERLHRGLVEPGALWVSDRPRWTAKGFDGEGDSLHNARLAGQLLDGWMAAPWGEPLREGLRAGARAAGGPSAALAVYNANGEEGELVPVPYWAPGIYTPMPVAGGWHPYHGLEFVPPRVLGRKSAQRLGAELGLQNFGVCCVHRGWAEDLVPDLTNQVYGTSSDWPAVHRQLAHRLFHRRKARFWETERMIDVIACFLQSYQFDHAPDAELDRWVRRFREDRASAARAFWSEVNAGLEEILGT